MGKNYAIAILNVKYFLLGLIVFFGIEVYSQCPVTAGFTSDATTTCTTVSFTNTSVAGTGEIASYFWDFGDGNTSAATNPSNTFPNPDPALSITYSVMLTVTDTSGCQNSVAYSVVIYQVPVAYFTYGYMACRQIYFTNNTQNNPD